MSIESARNQGTSDASKNLGPKAESTFKTSQEREAYNAAYNAQKNK